MTNTGSTPDRHALTFTKKSPTHQFIETLDVVLELCKHLCHSHWKKSLLAFGSTCRTLFEPAMDVLWCCLDVIVDLLKVIPNFVRVNKHFVCYSISGMAFKFAYLITESRLYRVRCRMAFCPDLTCMPGESEFCLGVFSQSVTRPPLRVHISQVSGVYWFPVYERFTLMTFTKTIGQFSYYSAQRRSRM